VLKNPELWLRPGADRRLKGGHCWVYSNEIDSERSHLPDFAAGDPVTVYSSSGRALASAYMEPHSLICARLVSRTADRQLDTELLLERIRSALALRQRYFPGPFYRLLYGDSDGVSGIVVDRFGDYLVIQLNTAGADRYCAALVDALVLVLAPTGVLVRRDSRIRQEQGLVGDSEVVFGEVPEQVELEENGCRFHAQVLGGQKTGWFYDHRDNRALLARHCKDRRMLDVYSYVGGWGVQGAAAGAREVTCIDNSRAALALALENARLNGVNDRVTTMQSRADVALRELADAGERFDVVVLDPPAFVQRRRDLGKGRKAYQRINELALGVLQPGGLLVSASCSMHMAEEDLVAAMGAAAQRCQRQLRITAFGTQAADHPVLPQVPETRYLKALFAEVSLAG
jgi:23S rRNA (cytosine1962-C5)-methyltransferase